jgi:hypothetical protein
MDRRAIASDPAAVYGGVDIRAGPHQGLRIARFPTRNRRSGRPAVDELEAYARACARLSDLEIEDAWWPAVVRHLGVLVDRAAVVEAANLGAGEPDAGDPVTR